MAPRSPDKELISPNLGLAIQARVKEMGTNPRRVSAEIEYAYDHVRKVYNGEVFPGKTLLKKICDYLKLNYDDMWAVMQIDKAAVKGMIPMEYTDEDSTLVKLRTYWKYLSKSDKQEVFDTVRIKADRHINQGVSAAR
jgi:hypothetical protein